MLVHYIVIALVNKCLAMSTFLDGHDDHVNEFVLVFDFQPNFLPWGNDFRVRKSEALGGGGRSALVLAATVSAKTNTPTFLQHRQIMFVHHFQKVWNFVQTNLLSGPWCCTCSRRSCTLFTRASLCADT